MTPGDLGFTVAQGAIYSKLNILYKGANAYWGGSLMGKTDRGDAFIVISFYQGKNDIEANLAWAYLVSPQRVGWSWVQDLSGSELFSPVKLV
jgi:hypothetical protein